AAEQEFADVNERASMARQKPVVARRAFGLAALDPAPRRRKGVAVLRVNALDPERSAAQKILRAKTEQTVRAVVERAAAPVQAPERGRERQSAQNRTRSIESEINFAVVVHGPRDPPRRAPDGEQHRRAGRGLERRRISSGFAGSAAPGRHRADGFLRYSSRAAGRQ